MTTYAACTTETYSQCCYDSVAGQVRVWAGKLARICVEKYSQTGEQLVMDNIIVQLKDDILGGKSVCYSYVDSQRTAPFMDSCVFQQ